MDGAEKDYARVMKIFGGRVGRGAIFGGYRLGEKGEGFKIAKSPWITACRRRCGD